MESAVSLTAPFLVPLSVHPMRRETLERASGWFGRGVHPSSPSQTLSPSSSYEDRWCSNFSCINIWQLAIPFSDLVFPSLATAARCGDLSKNMEASPAHSDAVAATDADAPALGSRLDFGKMSYGCSHYRRRCKIRAPCCNEVFTCRHCHNESVADQHELHRQDVQSVICLVCEAEQPPEQVCSNCGVNMGEYFCHICKFYDDDIEKNQYHCDDCGICRVGGQENFFHCLKCGSCYSVHLRNKHPCIENSMKHHCPICYEYLFDSLKEARILKCGHTMHSDCLQEMLQHYQYACPICSKSVIDMSRVWRDLDQEVEATIMPEDYLLKKVWILCNDCNGRSEVVFHVVGLKCGHCHSYNTRTVAPPVLPQ